MDMYIWYGYNMIWYECRSLDSCTIVGFISISDAWLRNVWFAIAALEQRIHFSIFCAALYFFFIKLAFRTRLPRYFHIKNLSLCVCVAISNEKMRTASISGKITFNFMQLITFHVATHTHTLAFWNWYSRKQHSWYFFLLVTEKITGRYTGWVRT